MYPNSFTVIVYDRFVLIKYKSNSSTFCTTYCLCGVCWTVTLGLGPPLLKQPGPCSKTVTMDRCVCTISLSTLHLQHSTLLCTHMESRYLQEKGNGGRWGHDQFYRISRLVWDVMSLWCRFSPQLSALSNIYCIMHLVFFIIYIHCEVY